VDNGAEEDRERDGSTSSSTTWRTCSSTWRMPRIEVNGEGEPVWLTPHLRDPQPEGERDHLDVRRKVDRTPTTTTVISLGTSRTNVLSASGWLKGHPPQRQVVREPNYVSPGMVSGHMGRTLSS